MAARKIILFITKFFVSKFSSQKHLILEILSRASVFWKQPCQRIIKLILSSKFNSASSGAGVTVPSVATTFYLGFTLRWYEGCYAGGLSEICHKYVRT